MSRLTSRISRYAEPCSDGGSEAKRVLLNEEYAKRTVISKILDSDPPDICIGDVVKYIYAQMKRRILKNPGCNEAARGTIRMGKRGMAGWDWPKLTYEAHENLDRRDIPDFPTPCWMPFPKVVPVFYGQNMSDLITPLDGNQLCKHWNPIPGGFKNNYLVASMGCIKELASDYSHDEHWLFFDNLAWEYKDESVFQPCIATCLADPKRCRKRPQILAEKKKTLKKRQRPEQNQPLQVPANGAVIFATARKDEKLLAK